MYYIQMKNKEMYDIQMKYKEIYHIEMYNVQMIIKKRMIHKCTVKISNPT